MKYKIVFTPESVLKEKTKPIAKVDKKIRLIVEEMKKTLVACTNPVGVGLAAPQVGLPLSIFIMRETPRSEIETFINPVEISRSGKIATDRDSLEGCLSVRNTWAHVARSKSIEISYLNLEGREVRQKFAGFRAHIIQHEMDHLNGRLFTERALEQNQEFYEIKKNSKGEEELVEKSI